MGAAPCGQEALGRERHPGRGFGFGTHVLGGGPRGPGLDFRTLDRTTPAAAIAEIEVNKKTGKITVKHVHAAIAPGFVVNPGRVADQVIGTAVMGTSQALLEEITFNTSNVTSLDWVTYRPCASRITRT